MVGFLRVKRLGWNGGEYILVMEGNGVQSMLVCTNQRRFDKDYGVLMTWEVPKTPLLC